MVDWQRNIDLSSSASDWTNQLDYKYIYVVKYEHCPNTDLQVFQTVTTKKVTRNFANDFLDF